MLSQSKGPWLGDTPTVIIYYSYTSSARWRNTYGFTYIDPQTGRNLAKPAAYAAALRAHYFSVVVLRTGRAGDPVDQAITKILYKDHRYKLTVIPEGTGSEGPTKVLVWQLVGGNNDQVGA